jgi:hypothetical protein
VPSIAKGFDHGLVPEVVFHGRSDADACTQLQLLVATQVLVPAVAIDDANAMANAETRISPNLFTITLPFMLTKFVHGEIANSSIRWK